MSFVKDYHVKREKIKGMDAWIKTINKSVLHKAIHVCSIHSMEDSSDGSQKLKQFLPVTN